MEALAEKIAELEARGVDRYDPVRFACIRSLTARARGKPAPVAATLRQKAGAALAAYEDDFDRARTETEKTVAWICARFPHDGSTARQLFDKNEFKQVQRFARRLDLRQFQRPLAELTDRLRRAASASPEKIECFSLDALLAQEMAAAASGGDGVGTEQTEMRSAKHFKEIIGRLHTDRLVARALQERPENPGPLNAQMLAIRSLSVLKELSPAYLSRFVTYIDTLIRLQQAGDDLDKRSPKKPK